MAKTLNTIVLQRIELTPDLIKLRVAPVGWEIPEFTPGQYTLLGLPWSAPRCFAADPEDRPGKNPERFIPRAFSIASSSKAREYLEFYIGLIRSGTLSPRLFRLKAGDRLWMSSDICGLFTLAEIPPDLNIVLIATGTGVAPYMSMIRTEIIEGLRRRMAVIHGARHLSDLGYHSELVTLDSLADTFSYFPVLSRPGEEIVRWPGQEGHIQDLWSGGVIDNVWGFRPRPQDTHVFLSGNPGMIDDMLKILEAEGFAEHTERTSGQVHVERYF